MPLDTLTITKFDHENAYKRKVADAKKAAEDENTT